MSKRNTLFHKLLLFWTIFQLQNKNWLFKGILWSQNNLYNTFWGHWLSSSLFYIFLWPNCKIFRKNISHVQYFTDYSKPWKGRIQCEIFLAECFMKYFFNVNFTVYLHIKFQVNCFFKLSWDISVKEIFSFQKLKMSFSEILFQKKLPNASLILLFKLRNREEVIYKNEKRVL